MTGLWVALSVSKSALEIRAVLEKWFPELVIVDWSFEQSTASLGSFPQNPDILFRIEQNASEFPICIQFDAFPGPQAETVIMPVMIELARRFADAFGCRSICDGSGYGDSQAPYWDIVWDSGKSFLADDGCTLFGDQAGGAVKIIREVDLPKVTLDNQGCLDDH